MTTEPIEITHPDWLPQVFTGERQFRTDEQKILLAVDLSRENARRGTGWPFGAAIFPVGGVHPLALGTNGVMRLRNSVAHAETMALMAAESALGSDRLDGHELFSSCEPCAMCLGAILWAGVRRVVFAALREDAERIGFGEGPVFPASHDYLRERGIEVVSGLRRAEAAAVLTDYAARGGPIPSG